MRRPSRDRWLVSYADFITLLFAFFVVMYSAAQLDKRRAAELATAIQTAFLQGGSLPPNPAGASVASSDATLLATRVEHTLAPEIASGDVAVRSSSEGLIVSLREIGFFDSGSDKIKPGAAAAFARLAEVLQPTTNHIRIEGHTDNVPIHNARFFSNWDLSSARATETVRLLIHDGLGPERLAAAGYSEYHAVASNDTPDGRALNRRVDVVIIRHTAP
ncbi:MAG TPA: OmpA family protein [Terriglobales bacterium]|jgi:chemotaxis protein MotB|nr:OmpA family protein [Terriglobales bacterium]